MNSIVRLVTVSNTNSMKYGRKREVDFSKILFGEFVIMNTTVRLVTVSKIDMKEFQNNDRHKMLTISNLARFEQGIL